LTCGKFFCAVF